MSARLEGAKELERMFATLGERVQRKVLRQSVSAATTPVVKAAKRNADDSKESGTLKKSLGRKIKTYTATQTVAGIVGPRTNVTGMYKGKVRKPSKYAHLVERGHIDEHGNFVPPKPFLGPAFESTKQQSLNVMKTKLGEGVTREAAKATQ